MCLRCSGGQRRLSPIAHRIADAVHHSFPRGVCFRCLAVEQRLDVHDVRGAALVVVVRAGVRMVQRPCSVCGRVEEVLMPGKAA
jgi:hypothetical protein